MSFERTNDGQNFQTQRGSAALYTLLLLPVVLSLSSLIIDVSAWNALRDKLQQEADRLAFQAANVLPSKNQAALYVQEAAASVGIPGVQAETYFPSDTPAAVGVRLRVQYKPSFNFFLRPFLQNTFRIERSGVAQLVPGDYVLVLADGASLRPSLQPIAGAPGQFDFTNWGPEIEWPASPYFRCVEPPTLSQPNELGWRWWTDWNKPAFQRWATQSCFNPVYSALKFAAIDLSQILLANPGNRLSVLFTPGANSTVGFRVLRHIHAEPENPFVYSGQRGGFPGAQAGAVSDAHWGGYVELDRLLGDEICMILADPTAALSYQYEHPGGLRSGKNPACLDALNQPPCGGKHRASGHLSDCYIDSSLSLLQAIYWNAAKLQLPSFSARPDVVSALRQAWTELVDLRALAKEQVVRGNMATNALRKIIIITDYLPSVNATSAPLAGLLTSFQAQHIETVFVSFAHDQLSQTAKSELLQRSTELRGWNPVSGEPSLVQTINVESPDELRTVVVLKLAAQGQQVALRS